MSFISILFNETTSRTKVLHAELPSFFVDLNLDQIVDSITEKWTDYELKPFFYLPLNNVEEIQYRHKVFRDLENGILYEHVKLFAERMQEVRSHLNLSEKMDYKYQKEVWFLYAAEIYCSGVKSFTTALSSIQLMSKGFNSFQKFLNEYTADNYFTSLTKEVSRLKTDLENVQYRIIIKEGAFTVQDFAEEDDYSKEINETFEKFRQGAVRDYRIEYKSTPQTMNHIEAKILEFVAQLNPELFSRLEHFCESYSKFIDETVERYDREIHFYIAYLEHTEKFKQNGLKFCYPAMVNSSKEIYSYDGFDLALAQKLYETKTQIVCNDFYLKEKERVIVVTGPNQGGKTTFARTFGQLHFLASIGGQVPGSKAQLFFFDKMFTQFEKAEKVENLRGKLEDDLTRIRTILEKATPRSIIIMNEIFNSTTLQDVSFLSNKIMEKILEKELLGVWVTFVDELASFSEQTVSMTSTIVPENPALRTFKIVRRPADGLAYAMAIAEKHRLTFHGIKERIES